MHNLLSRLEQNDEGDFNNDEQYKQLIAEAIDGKGHALSKMKIYFESLAAGFGVEALARIRDEPLESFSCPATVMALRTGAVGFPWAAVVSERSAAIDLGEWDAAAIPRQARERVVAALGSNSNMRSVLVKGARLDFSDGWETKALDWRGNEAVKALPATVAVLLCNCTCLSNLDLRFLPRIKVEVVTKSTQTYLPSLLYRYIYFSLTITCLL